MIGDKFIVIEKSDRLNLSTNDSIDRCYAKAFVCFAVFQIFKKQMKYSFRHSPATSVNLRNVLTLDDEVLTMHSVVSAQDCKRNMWPYLLCRV